MAPNISYSKEDIVTAAVEVVRKSGTAAVSARNVAKELGGSTQPIYRAFSSVERLLKATTDRAGRIALSWAGSATDQESSFLAIGLGYLAFSRAEPNLFRLLVSSGRATWSPVSAKWPLYELTDKMREDPVLSQLSEARLRTLLRDMFIYTHGLSALSPPNPTEEDRAEERELLRYVGGRLMALAALEDVGAIDLDETMRRFHR